VSNRTITSKVIIDLYEKLAELEKEGKKNSQDYKNYIDLLLFSLEKESIEEEIKEINQTEFHSFKESKKLLQDIRDYHKLKQTKYSLEGNKFQIQIDDQSQDMLQMVNSIITIGVETQDFIDIEEAKKIIELSFYQQLNKQIHNPKLLKEEKDTLIDIKYALLATSKYVEQEVLLNGEMLDIELSLPESDREEILYIVLKKAQIYANAILDIEDRYYEKEKVIPTIVYAKTLIGLLPSMYKAISIQEMENALYLTKMLSRLKNESQDKSCELIKKIMLEPYYEKVKEYKS
jgi:hypothetical protein